jgi:CubicO group peptidase (beta-lactamase class C family)
MEKVIAEIQSAIKGDIETGDQTRQTYSHDTSLFEVIPQAVVFPKDAADVRVVVEIVNRHKKANPELSITARSAGTDMSGGAINDSLIMVFERYMNAMGNVGADFAVAQPGVFQHHKCLSPATIDRMTRVLSNRMDLTLGMEAGWAAGVVLNGTTTFFGPNPRTYGHSGWGGSFGCADPDRRLAIGYVCNQMGPRLVGDERASGLCATVYGCL